MKAYQRTSPICCESYQNRPETEARDGADAGADAESTAFTAHMSYTTHHRHSHGKPKRCVRSHVPLSY